MTVQINGTSGLVFNDASTQNTAATGFGFKNRIINGAMMIDQRNAGASVTPTDGQYTLDRWIARVSAASKYSVQQSTTVPNGFKNSLLVTSLSAYSVGSSELFEIGQRIEGFNLSDLGWGTANAQTVTLSFQVRSSLTGTFGGSLRNADSTRSYPFSFTISSANTYETKTVTIAGDTSGTWNTGNGIGLQVTFSLGSGSTFSGTANTWASAVYSQPTGATSVVGTNGATFYITGVQLEKGSTATSFDYRPYGTELQLCMRYYQKSYEIGTVPATATTVGSQGTAATQGATTGNEVNSGVMRYPVPMRTSPTVTIYDESGNSGKVNRVNAGVADNQNQTGYATGSRPSANSLSVYSPSGATATGLFVHYSSTAEL